MSDDNPQYDADGLTEDGRIPALPWRPDRQQALEIQISKDLFGQPALHAPWYATDWNAIPKLVEQCERRGWEIQQEYTRTGREPWFVLLVFDDGGVEYNACEAHADTLPRALCRAIVAVLDALEETTKDAKGTNEP